MVHLNIFFEINCIWETIMGNMNTCCKIAKYTCCMVENYQYTIIKYTCCMVEKYQYTCCKIAKYTLL